MADHHKLSNIKFDYKVDVTNKSHGHSHSHPHSHEG